MLKARSLQFICTSCRINHLASTARNAQPLARTEFSWPSSFPHTSAVLTPRRNVTSRRAFSSTVRAWNPQRQGHTNESSDDVNDLPPTPADRLDIEVNVRRARQMFGDALPRGHLSEEEFVVYERLYGTPVFVDSVADLQEASEADVEIIEEEQPDGTTVLLRKGEDGTMEEIEVFDESNESVEQESEELLEDGEFMTPEEWEERKDQKAQQYHDEIYEKSRLAQEEEETLEDIEEEEDNDFMRAHPLTVAGRFKPSTSTVFLPKETLVDPTALLLTRANHKHLAESANRVFGGPGLPFSASTPAARLGKEQKSIPLDPSQSEMGNIEADIYMASVQPGTYTSVMSALVEVRRRLGTPWMERILQKKGGMILDAGSGGVGVLAWHEILRAEWQRMQDESEAISQDSAPLGKATVLAASDTLRHRASRLLENTTFIPRLPDSVSSKEDANTPQPRKVYDLIIAPHTLWPLKQEYLRKEQIEKYWSLLNPKGGVLLLIEKGLPRGFEVIAGARQLLLDKHIASPDSAEIETPLQEQVSKPDEDTRYTQKETGMIVAPCTNHSTCPMYQSPGISQGRKDFCFFSQRYIRPPYLQRILNAKDRNHEDIQFSYLAVQRGRDQRLADHDLIGKGVMQNEKSATQAFEGHEWNSESELRTTSDVNPLSLPRLILPALKRRGHIILDVCTPAGRLERWTVPRSFSKQAFRDARKARWGDLWALGAKTRIPRNVRLGKPRDEFDKKGRRIKAPKKMTIELGIGDNGEEGTRIRNDGRYNPDRKIRGSGGRKGRKKHMNVDDL